MFECPHCGNQLPDGAAFCNQCWRPVDDPPLAARRSEATGAGAHPVETADPSPTGADDLPTFTPAPGGPPQLANVDADAPVVVCGVGISLVGKATPACPAAATPTGGTRGAAPVDYLVNADVEAPITVCGIGLALGGDAVGACPAPAPTGVRAATRGTAAPAPATAAAAGKEAAAGGGLLNLKALLPIRVCGIALALGHDATGTCPEAPSAAPAVPLHLDGLADVDLKLPITLPPDLGKELPKTGAAGAATKAATGGKGATGARGARGAGGARDAAGTGGGRDQAAIVPAAALLPLGMTRLVRRTAKLAHPLGTLPMTGPPAAADPSVLTGAEAAPSGTDPAYLDADRAADLGPVPQPGPADDLLLPIGTGIVVLSGGLLSTAYRERLRHM